MASMLLGMGGYWLGGQMFGSMLAARIGWMAGSYLGSMLFGEDTNMEGPRLSSLDVQTSTYTRVIPHVIGTERQTGNVIWKTPLQEVAKTESAKGGPSTSYTTYTYYATFALSVCEGEKEVVKIWANNKLIYDTTQSEIIDKYPNVIKIYNGTETQEPDPVMESVEGIGNVPAYRGQCYILFDGLPVADYANTIPKIDVLVTDSVTPSYDMYRYDEVLEAGAFGTYMDWRSIPGGDKVYGVSSVSNPSYLIELDLRANTTRLIPFTYGGIRVSTLGSNWCDKDYYYLWVETSGVTLAVWAINLHDGSGHYATGNTTYTNCHITSARNGPLYYSYGSSLVYQGMFGDELIGSAPLCMCPGDGADIWAVYQSGTATAYTVRHYHYGSLVREFDVDVGENTIGESTTCFYHSKLESLFINRQPSPSRFYRIDVIAEALTGTLSTYFTHTAVYCASYTSQGRYMANGSGSAIVLYDLYEMEQVSSVSTLSYTDQDGGSMTSLLTSYFYDDDSNAVFANDNNTGRLWKLYTQHQTYTDTMTLEAAVQDLCDLAGVESADRVTSALSGYNITGYKLDRRAPVRAFLEPLAAGFMFDAVESDGKIKFVVRNATSVKSLTEEDILESGEESFAETIQQEVELPNQLDLMFINPETDFNNSNFVAKRYDTATFTRANKSIALPFAVKPDEIKDNVYRLLQQAWVRRKTYSFNAPISTVGVDPTDVIDVTFNSTSFTMEVDTVSLSPDHTISYQCSLADPVTYTITGDISYTDGYVSDDFVVPGFADVAVLDLPAITIGQINGDPHLLFAAGTYYPGFRGVEVEQSTDDVVYVPALYLPEEGILGKTENKLPDHDCAAIDRTNYITISAMNDAPTSQTLDAIVADEHLNLIAVGSELVQYADVETLDTGRYKLTTLIRGRFGTENQADTHVAGELVVAYDIDKVKPIAKTLTDLNGTFYYNSYPVGAARSVNDFDQVTFTANTLKPWFPVYVTAERDAVNDDIDIGWTRRDRRLASAFWTPSQSEDSEEYNVEVYNTSDVLLRTINVASATTTTYTEAMQTTDGHTHGDAIKVIIYQVSAQVGNGHPSETVTSD